MAATIASRGCHWSTHCRRRMATRSCCLGREGVERGGRGRREVVLFTGAVAAGAPVRGGGASELLSDAKNAAPRGKRKSVLITGANSGIGFDATVKLVRSGELVYAACRTKVKAEEVVMRVDSLLADVPDKGRVIPLECDLGSLESVRRCAADVSTLTNKLGCLVLNAGVQFAGETGPPRRTIDGFEYTVGVNHLGHFLLTNLLLPKLVAYGNGARIVVTASEVHDPESAGGKFGPPAHLGDLSGLMSGNFSTVDGQTPYDPDAAYKNSKALNIVFTKELSYRLQNQGIKPSQLTVNAFNPGLITKSGFFRNTNPVFVSIFDFVANTTGAAVSVEDGADCLVFMVESETLDGISGTFYSNGIGMKSPLEGNFMPKHQFKEEHVSKEAASREIQQRAWELSEKLVGV